MGKDHQNRYEPYTVGYPWPSNSRKAWCVKMTIPSENDCFNTLNMFEFEGDDVVWRPRKPRDNFLRKSSRLVDWRKVGNLKEMVVLGVSSREGTNQISVSLNSFPTEKLGFPFPDDFDGFAFALYNKRLENLKGRSIFRKQNNIKTLKSPFSWVFVWNRVQTRQESRGGKVHV